MQKPDVVCTNGVTVATFGPEQAELGSPAITELKEIQTSVEQMDPPRMVINLESVSNVDAAFLDFLLELNQYLRFQVDGKLGVCNIPERFRHNLSLLNRDSCLEVFETCEDAIAAFSIGE